MAANPVVPIPKLQIERRSAEGTVTVICTGKLTNDTTQLLQTEVRQLIPATKHIVLDLGAVSYMDSSGLGALVGLFVSAKSKGTRIELRHLSSRIAELIRLTKLTSVFEDFGEYL